MNRVKRSGRWIYLAVSLTLATLSIAAVRAVPDTDKCEAALSDHPAPLRENGTGEAVLPTCSSKDPIPTVIQAPAASSESAGPQLPLFIDNEFLLELAAQEDDDMCAVKGSPPPATEIDTPSPHPVMKTSFTGSASPSIPSSVSAASSTFTSDTISSSVSAPSSTPSWSSPSTSSAVPPSNAPESLGSSTSLHSSSSSLGSGTVLKVSSAHARPETEFEPTFTHESPLSSTVVDSIPTSSLDSGLLTPSPASVASPQNLPLSKPIVKSSSPVCPSPVSPKISKERFNYASFDCGALILAHNPEASSVTSILHNNKDAYMLNKCAAKRFVTVELCDDILVDTIMLANFEFFSSMFKDFQVHVSNRYPPKNNGWVLLGDFRAKNVRDFQYFKVENPRIWARYIRATFISEYSHEYYCPLSMLRVYGTTMMEEMKAEEEKAAAGNGALKEQDLVELIPPLPVSSTSGNKRPAGDRPRVVESPRSSSFPVGPPRLTKLPPLVGGLKAPLSQSPAARGDVSNAFGSSLPIFSMSGRERGTRTQDQSARTILVPEHFYAVMSSKTVVPHPDDNDFAGATQTNVIEPDAPPGYRSQPLSDNPATDGELGGDMPPNADGAAGTQESIFRTMLKRINLLERNATLSYIFLEEQSKALNDIFKQSLVREQDRFEALLGHFNSTLYHIFTDLHVEYTKAWGILTVDAEAEQRRVDAKIAEVNRVIETLDKQ
ncbi:hypothetical protein PhCBS80983_g03670, partial [Powellomyces hirtus]